MTMCGRRLARSWTDRGNRTPARAPGEIGVWHRRARRIRRRCGQATRPGSDARPLGWLLSSLPFQSIDQRTGRRLDEVAPGLGYAAPRHAFGQLPGSRQKRLAIDRGEELLVVLV